MDNDTSPPGATERGLPKTSPFSTGTSGSAASSPLVPTRAAVAEQNDRSGIFGHLVKDDADIAGLVAYSIYKQNKLDWLRAFEAAKGRVPEDAELSSYIIGEGTARRLATYRHLAEATLAGNGPDVEGAGGVGRGRRSLTADTKKLTNGLMITYGLIALLFVIVLWFAAHFTVSSH